MYYFRSSSVCTHVFRHLFYCACRHDDVIKGEHFARYCPFVRGIHRWPVNSPHKGQWREALIFSLICAWINGWVNNRETGDLRRHRAHYAVTVMDVQRDLTRAGGILRFNWSRRISLDPAVARWIVHRHIVRSIPVQSVRPCDGNVFYPSIHCLSMLRESLFLFHAHRIHYRYTAQWPLLLTCINFNPKMDE